MIETEGQVQHSPRRGLDTRQTRLILVGIIVTLVGGYLIVNATTSSTTFYVTIDELEQQDLTGRSVRVAGHIIGESIVWEPRDLRLEFDIVDQDSRLPVSYIGPRPDMFRDGAEVVLEGHMSPTGVFEAQTIILKCPSKYEEAQ